MTLGKLVQSAVLALGMFCFFFVIVVWGIVSLFVDDDTPSERG